MIEIVASISLGIGLAAAAGLRVFVPLFGSGIAARLGYLQLNDGFGWLTSWTALVVLGTATVVEILAYYVPWLDHLLDALTTPAALVAGVIASAAVITDLPAAMRWIVAIVGGGGVAAAIQAVSVGSRINSTLSTGGLANPLVSTVETVGATVIVVLAVVVPVIALLLLGLTGFLVYRFVGRMVWYRPPLN
ncbi:MAG: DUF4126 domain-containing protein [Gemmatimonadota bacterium]